MARVTNILKNIVLVIIIIQLTPSLMENIKKQYKRLNEPGTKVALVEISGTINDSAHYTNSLRKYFEDHEIRAILLKINSGGGAAGSGQAIFNEIQYLQKQYPKTIITLSENILGSAAFYIACATDWIITAPSTIVGSIGGYLPHQFKLKEFAAQWKIYVEQTCAGKYKNAGDPFCTTTSEQHAMLQALADDAYNQFVRDIATTRKLSLDKQDEWADGKIFTGNQAHRLGLIDEVGSWSSAINRLKDKALIDGSIEWVTPSRKNHVLEFLGMESTDEIPESVSSRDFYKNIAQACLSVLEDRKHNEIKM